MNQSEKIKVKKNVSKFDEDVLKTGSYAYTAERLSSRLANGNISHAIARSYDFKGKRILDLGCGDGAYTLEFPALGVSAVLGSDPAEAAIKSASQKSEKLGLSDVVRFEVGNIYELGSLLDAGYDCIVLRGVLHHLPDAAEAIQALGAFRGTVIILEPNGNNPVLKLLEKYSRYHVEHEERSFTPRLLRSWLTNARFSIVSCEVLNLVPMFCPTWMARLGQVLGPVVERVPLLRDILCGQTLIVARK
jgi:2-polyprenyl-3-methyl-5-hydroxy-6-metoxy-1,4-benzoquinol methylase